MPRRELEKSVTVQDVARQAGVSAATVSRTISTPEVVSEQTRDLVLEAIRHTGYRVNQAARNLRKKRSGAVLVLVPNLGNPFFSQILASLNATFSNGGYSVLISDSNVQESPGHQVVDYLLDGRVDGVVCLDGSLTNDDLEQFHLNGLENRIVFACEWLQDAPYPSVRSDNRKGARMAVEHLYEFGHRKIAHITGPRGNVLTAARREGMLHARQKLGLPLRDEWIIRGDFSVQSGWKSGDDILKMKERPTAVFCASDMVALGLIARLNAAGLSVPQDMSVVGFDDIELAAFSLPSLTTIRQDRSALGEQAAGQLLKRLENDGELSAACEINTIDVTLISRDSCSAPVANPT
ncbi:MAG: LacI family DNA-binding transcriptional regulator [Ruegeria sp.]